MVLGLLLASRGIKVTVIESHKDFEREYRGEVLMPRFIQMMTQIGLFEHLQSYPHLKLKNFEFFFKDRILARVSLSQLCQEAPCALWMPQPILLNALLDKAKEYPNFTMMFGVVVKDLLRENGKIVGVMAEKEGKPLEIRSSVTVGADGRFSIVRKAGNFKFDYEHYDFDLIWFTVKHPLDYKNTVRAFFSSHYRYLILPKYPDLVQCGLLVEKGKFPQLRARGIETFRKELLEAHPVMKEFAQELKDFSPFSVLQARVSYVEKWARDGCLLIGDAAHTCSPAGAIGVSVAVGTAIVAADVLIEAFTKKDFSERMLSEVQRRRAEDVKKIQRQQSRFTRILGLFHPYLNWISVAAILSVAKTGILKRGLRRIALMDEPLPINLSLHF